MKFSNKLFSTQSFIGVFVFVFSFSLIVFASVQAIFGTLRWYNASEQWHEKLQEYPVYSATEESSKGVIRVFIGQKPAQNESNVYVFLQKNEPIRQEALKTVTPEKAAIITKKIQETIDSNTSTTTTTVETIDSFKSPVQVRIAPDKTRMPQGYSHTIDIVLTGIYFRDTLWKFPLTVDNNRTSPRGQMTNESVILSGRIKSLSEMAKVLVHELGHMIDIYLLRTKWATPDPSKNYYAISWSEPTVLLSGAQASDFVSGYAATNQYEDFAEAFAMYVFHNTTFLERAQQSSALQQKYDFMKERVFLDYFIGTSYEQNPLPTTLWDVTKIVIKTNALGEIFARITETIKILT
jgi:hypothetical protein